MIDPIQVACGALIAGGVDPLLAADLARQTIDAYEEAKNELELHGFHPEDSIASVRLRPTQHDRPWTQVTIKTIAVRGGGPYQDTIDVYEATFNGGHPSNTPGYELPFGVPGAFDPGMWKNTTSFPPKTMAEREASHYANIKKRIRGMIPGHGWEVDLAGGEENRMGATVLEKFEFVRRTEYTSTFRLTLRKPNMS